MTLLNHIFGSALLLYVVLTRELAKFNIMLSVHWEVICSMHQKGRNKNVFGSGEVKMFRIHVFNFAWLTFCPLPRAKHWDWPRNLSYGRNVQSQAILFAYKSEPLTVLILYHNVWISFNCLSAHSEYTLDA